LLEYLFTPFGLSNTTQTFQRMMDRTTDGLEGVFAYMDDSREGSPYRQTHLHHLEAFFKALAANGLAINLEKCVFATPSLEILGHTISATGAAPTADHATKIKNCPPPQDIKQLQHFLGMVNFYRRFLPKCSQILKPLTDLLKGGPKTLGVDRFHTGGIPKCKTSPCGGGAHLTSCPKC
jgi:putative transposase